MNFQLVRASDTEIAIWNTDHGHIFVYEVAAGARALRPAFCREVPDAALDAASMTAEALGFATEEARLRKLLAP